jgi:hypothetical protein
MDNHARYGQWSLQCPLCGRVFHCLPEDLYVFMRADWPKCCDMPMYAYRDSYYVRRSFLPGVLVAQMEPVLTPEDS